MVSKKSAQLLKKIEKIRLDIHQLSKTMEMNSDLMISKSQELDVLINRYYRLKQKHRLT